MLGAEGALRQARAPGAAVLLTQSMTAASGLMSRRRQWDRHPRGFSSFGYAYDGRPHLRRTSKIVEALTTLVGRVVQECDDHKPEVQDTTLRVPKGAIASGACFVVG